MIEDRLNLPKKPSIYGAGLSSSWEIDIWGKLRKASKSAYYEYLASVEARNFAKTQLIAEITNNYYELLALDNQLEIVEQYIQTLKYAQEVVALEKFAGRTISFLSEAFKYPASKKPTMIFCFISPLPISHVPLYVISTMDLILCLAILSFNPCIVYCF